MIIAALLALQSYSQLPPPIDAQSRVECTKAHSSLSVFVIEYKNLVSSYERDRGGRLTFDQAADWRYEAELLARPYLEQINELRFRPGTARLCHELGRRGREAVVEYAVIPRFGDWRGEPTK
jgi:hypothetical protein